MSTQTSKVSSSRPAIPLNVSAAFAQFAHLSSVLDGRNLHRLASENAAIEVAGDERPVAAASKLLETLKGVSYSLTAAMAQPILDQRVITLYKENSEHEHAIHKAVLTAQLTLQMLSAAHQPASLVNHYQPSVFGLELPIIRSRINSFILSSLERWATEAGLEFFLDDQHSSAMDSSIPFPSTAGITTEVASSTKSKKFTASMTKEQLLVDIEFESHPLAEDKRIDLVQNDALAPISLLQIKVHNGQKDDSSAPVDAHPGGTLQALLEETIRGFLKELGCGSGQSWRSLDVRKAEKAAAKLKVILGELGWIAETVKQETEKSVESGREWSECISTMAEKAMSILKKETETLEAPQDPSALKSKEALPVDLVALRTSAIPIPFLLSISLSFLVYVPPLAYLTARRHFGSSGTKGRHRSDGEVTDIPLTLIRELVSDSEVRERLDVLIATISYEPTLQITGMPSSTATGDESMIPLDESSSGSVEGLMGHTFLTRASPEPRTGGWALSFSQGDMGHPLTISQVRMRRIASAIHLDTNFKDEHNFGLIGLTAGSALLGPSWLDLAIDPQCAQPSRIYTSRYQPKLSTDGDDPDLVNTLMAITEPGVALGKVPVRTFKEAYAVMQVVKEQIWLQTLLRGAGFRPGYDATDLSGMEMGRPEQMMNDMNLGGRGNLMGEDEAKAMYDALMNGTYVAKRLRVTYEVLGDGQTGVRMTFPFGEAAVVTEVTLDLTLPKGVKVAIAGQRVDALEEVVRRGGLIGLVIAVRRFVSERV